MGWYAWCQFIFCRHLSSCNNTFFLGINLRFFLFFICRDFLFYLSSPNVTKTNPNCAIKTEIVCNRSPSTVIFSLIPSVQGNIIHSLPKINSFNNQNHPVETSKLKEIKINSDNLNALELLQICNKYVTALAPKDEPVNVIKTKSEKKAGARRK